MKGNTRAVVLTDEQIAFVKKSIDYSLKRIRDTPLDPIEDRAAALDRRRGQEEMAATIERALRDAS